MREVRAALAIGVALALGTAAHESQGEGKKAAEARTRPAKARGTGAKSTDSPCPRGRTHHGGTEARRGTEGKTPGHRTTGAKGERGARPCAVRAELGAPGARRRTGARAPLETPRAPLPTLSVLPGPIRCPPEMVAVAGRVCVDRYEATLVDVGSGAPLSPFYPPAREAAATLFETWSRARDAEPDGTMARLMPVPPPWPADVQPGPLLPRATSVAGFIPNGYVSGLLAAEACRSAGKRLCTDAEWRTACRGADRTQFPYGATYRQDACNVFREEHPAHLLHGSAAHNHHDPRLNLVTFEGRPLLRATGATPSCASRWNDDAVYDMVGNLDEWIEDPEGTFLGGFFSRATRAGCESRIGGHPIDYFDYSTGVRCCKNPD